MNILILSWRGPKHPNAGGAEISTLEHAKGWVKAGHEVTLFTSAFINCKSEEVMNGVKIIRKGRQFIGVQWEAFKWYLFGNHPKFDLIIDQFHGIPFFTPLYIKSKKLAFIHEVTKNVWRLNPWPWPYNKIAAFIGEVFEPLIIKLYKKIPFMTVSKSTKDDLALCGILRDEISIIYNGVTIPKTTRMIKKENNKTLIFLGALTKDKGIEDALKVFQLITQLTKGTCQFWVVGPVDSGYLKILKRQCKELEIDERVKFWGFVSEKKKFELLARAHLAINPSVREGWSLVVIEAATVGTPTVGYNVAGLRDSIIHNRTGLLVDPNPISLAKKVNIILKNDKLYKKLQTRCILWSKRFSWKKSVLESTKLITNLANQKENKT